MINKVFYELDMSEQTFISFWRDVCNIESPTECKAGVDKVGEYFSNWAKSRGFKVEMHLEDVSGNAVCITMNPDAKGRPIALSGHMDTVHPVGSFGSPAVKVDGDRIYGPGVLDCKGGIVAAAYAMDALAACGYTDRPVMLLLQSDEEVGSRTSNKATIGFICEKAKDAEAFLNLEGYSEGKITLSRKGILNILFKVQGVEAHSARCAKEGASAILEAAHKIIEMEKLKDHDGLTCNCGTVSGGSVPNTVAGYCEFVANIRYSTSAELEYVRQYAKQVADTVHVEGCSCETAELSFRVAMEYTERNAELADRLNRAWAAAGLEELIPTKRSGGSDAADVTAYGIPCVESLGVAGNSIHSPSEYALIPSLKDSAKRIATAALLL